MDKKTLASYIGTQLAPYGFKRKTSTWYRECQRIVQVVNLQKSSYGMQFYVNLCCAPIGMQIEGMPTPKEHKCPIRIRLTSAFPNSEAEIKSAFDLELVEIGESERKARLTSIISQLILPFLANMNDVHSLGKALSQGKFKLGMVTVAAQQYLDLGQQGKAR